MSRIWELTNAKGERVKLELAEPAGFCFGVARAVDMTEGLLAEGKNPVTLGPLIHNPQVVEKLRRQGVQTVARPEEALPGQVAVVRSHGMPTAAYEALEAGGVQVADATCPYVAKIHKIARQAGEAGAVLLVAGNPAHPEVEGIVGHAAGPVHVFDNAKELEQVLEGLAEDTPVWVVAQTTHAVEKWFESVETIKKRCTKAKVFDTICNATRSRQEAAEALARRCDLVIVVGGRGSSNTEKLLRVAQAHTRAVQIESASELDGTGFKRARAIGVTAGASTPLAAIEEVITTMSDEIREGGMTFEEMLDESMKPVYAGQIVKGVVVAVSASEVTVDIGTKHTGIIKLEELTDDPAVRNAEDVVKRDEELDLVVVKVSDQDGIVYLSKRQMEARKGAQEVAQAAEDGTVMDGYVIESNKGGLVANVKGVKVFIPASQATMRRGEDYTALVRSHVKLKIKEFSPRRAIGSIREVAAVEQAAKREAFWNEVEVGRHYVGTVKSLTSYGAFVDIGGVDGLVHISELSWNRIKHPSEVVSPGDTIEVYVKDLDRENQKVSLGFKRPEDNPWEKFKAEYPIGSVFTAPVVSLTQFGAFVRIMPGIDGLVHISEISHDRVEKVADALSVGQEVEVKLLDVDYDRKRISLSMKALLPEPEQPRTGPDAVVASASAEETTVAPDIEAEMEAEAPAAKPEKAQAEAPAAEEAPAEAVPEEEQNAAEPAEEAPAAEKEAAEEPAQPEAETEPEAEEEPAEEAPAEEKAAEEPAQPEAEVAPAVEEEPAVEDEPAEAAPAEEKEAAEPAEEEPAAEEEAAEEPAQPEVEAAPEAEEEPAEAAPAEEPEEK